MALSLVTAPTVEAVTMNEILAHLRVNSRDEVLYIQSLVTAATEFCQTFTRRQFVTATYRLSMNSLGDTQYRNDAGEIEIPLPPLQSVSSITYVDTAGTAQTLTSSLYTVDSYSEPGRIAVAYNATWPADRADTNAVAITFVAGYGVAYQVPERIKQAIKLTVSHLFENRGDDSKELPQAAKQLLYSVRWGSYP